MAANSDWRMVNDFSGGQCSRNAERISAHQEMRPPVTGFWAYSIVIKIVGFGTKQKWEGEAPAEPKRQRIATGD
jgi:hypothetical protein